MSTPPYEALMTDAVLAMGQLMERGASHSPAGRDAAEAVRQAMLQWLEEGKASTLHTSAWAAKVLAHESPEWDTWTRLTKALEACTEVLAKEPPC